MTTLRLDPLRCANLEKDASSSPPPPPKQHAKIPLRLPRGAVSSSDDSCSDDSSLFIIAVATMSSDMSKSKSSSILLRVISSLAALRCPSFRVCTRTRPLSITNISVPSSPCCMSKSPFSYVLETPTEAPSMINRASNASSVSIEFRSSRAVGSAVAVSVASTAGSVPPTVTHAWHMISFSVARSSGFLSSTLRSKSTRSALIAAGISGSTPVMAAYTSFVVSPLKGTLPHTM